MGSRKLLPAILTCLIAPLASSGARADEIRWFTDYAVAMREASDKNRPVFLDVYKVPCPPCKYLDDVIYRDPAVIKYFNDNFISVKINGELNEVRIKDNHKIAEFPTLVYLSPDQKVLEMNVGFLEVAPLLDLSRKSMLTLAALPPRKRPTPFKGLVRTGMIPLNLWGTSARVFPPQTATFSVQPLTPAEERTQQAREQLAQAVDSFRKQNWLSCLDQSRSVMSTYPDLAEGTEARQLEQSIGTERIEKLEKDLIENLGQVYWELAQTRLRQNQRAEATSYMEKLVQTCPGTRHAAAAQEFLRASSNKSSAGEQLHATHLPR